MASQPAKVLDHRQTPDNCLLFLLRARLTMFLERDMFTDVTIVTNTFDVRAHSIVLAGASLYFETHLSFPCGDVDSSLIPVPFEGKLIAKLVNYIYTGNIEFTDDVYDMMALQDFFQIGSLRNLISDFLVANLRIENVGKTVEEADKYRYTDLAARARQFFASNFKSLVADNSFIQVSFDLIRESLEADYLVTGCINELIYNLCRWVGFDEVERGRRLKEFLDKINPIELSDWIKTKERCLALFPETSPCAAVLNLWFEQNAPQSRPTVRGSGLPRFKTTLEDVILVLGGIEDNHFAPTVEAIRRLPERCRRSLPLYAGQNYPICEPPTLIFSSMRLEHSLPLVAASNGRKVFVTSPLRNIECYCVPNNEWYPLPKYPDSVSLGRITTLDESLFICGPNVKNTGHELFALPKSAKQWKRLSPPCSTGGELTQFTSPFYGSTLVGFFLENDRRVTIQHYDVTLDLWTPTFRLPESWPLQTATPIDCLNIFIAINADSWCCYNTVSCCLSDPIRAMCIADRAARCQCSSSGPHVNESALLGNLTVVQKTCCAICVYALQNESAGRNVEFRPGIVTKKTNFAIAVVKIGSYGWPKL